MFSKLTMATVAAVALAITTTGPALADATVGKLPAPGVLGLVAIGVIGAIALAKLRK